MLYFLLGLFELSVLVRPEALLLLEVPVERSPGWAFEVLRTWRPSSAESAWATSREWMCYREEDYAFVQEAQRDPLDREMPE